MSCLRVPTFLGVHTIALGEEISLDDGGVRLWTGAVTHDDPTADAATTLLQEQQRYYATEKPTKAALEVGDRASQVFSSAPASGSRVLGGPFLRAALDGERCTGASGGFLHVWLAGGKALVDDGGDSGDALHWIGPYRVRLISSSICTTGSGTADSLHETETLMVQVAVDRVAGGREEATAALPGPGEEVCVWLSTQAAHRLCLTAASDGSTGEAPAACDAEPQSPAGALPPLPSPPCQRQSETESLELALHAAAHGALDADGGFGCAAALWAAELSLMSLGEHEAHAALPLRPSATADSGRRVRVGRYEVRVLQCIGHFLREEEEGAPREGAPRARAAARPAGTVASDYPLLLLHVQLRVRRRKKMDAEGDGGEALMDSRAQRQAEARRLGEGLESLLGL